MTTLTAPIEKWSRRDLVEIAKWQRFIILLLVVVVLGLVLTSALGSGYHIVMVRLGLLATQIYFIYKLASAFRADYPIVYALACLLPWVNVIVLLYANNKATNILRANGQKVGLLGAKIDPETEANLPNQAL